MKRPYRSYLLRLWQSGPPEDPTWLASLEDPHTRQVIAFSHPHALWEFIEELITRPTEHPPPADDREA